jgi:uncharacterized protein involved in exopolysaccharide biosynthesis
LNQQLDDLEADHNAATQELSSAAEGDRPRLKRKIAAIEQEMDQVAVALNALGA